MSSIDYSSSISWIPKKIHLPEQDSLARLQNPVAPGYQTRLFLHAGIYNVIQIHSGETRRQVDLATTLQYCQPAREYNGTERES